MRLLLPVVITGMGLPAVLSAAFGVSLLPQEQATVVSPVGGHVVWTVEDGAVVEEGDLVVRLDAGDLKDDRNKARIEVAQAEAGLQEKRAQVELAQITREQALAGAELAVEMAEMGLARSKAAVSLEQRTLQRRLELATATLELHQQQYAVVEQRVKRGIGSTDELRDVRLALLRAEGEREEAEGRLQMHQEFEAPMELRKAEYQVQREVGDLEKMRRQVEIQVAQDQARLHAADSGVQLAQARLDRVEQKLAGTEVHAPVSGKVALLVPVGSRVRERQPLLQLIAR